MPLTDICTETFSDMDVQYKLNCDFKGAFIAAHPELKADAALKSAQEKWNVAKKNKMRLKT